MTFNMPIEQEADFESKKGGGGTPPKDLWKGLPLKAGTSHTNNVLIPMFSPHTWSMFNPTPEMAQKYGLVGSGLQGMVADNLLNTFYFKLPTHQVPNYQRPDGSVGFSDVVCPIELNKYLVEALGRNPLFAAPVRCAHCEEGKRRWDAHNNRWDQLGINKKDLSSDGYRSQIDSDPVLKSTRIAARAMQVRHRYVLSIFDLDKMLGVRPLDEGETGVEKQLWLAPAKIKDKLINLWNASLNFCSNQSAGFPVLGITKNTEKCTANNMMKTEWDVITVGRFEQLDPQWLQYVTDVSSMVDPSKFVHLVTYEEATYYIQSEQADDQGGNNYEQGQAPVGNATGLPPQGVPPMGMPASAAGMPPVTSSPMVAPGTSPVAAAPAGMPPQGMPPQAAAPAGMPPQGQTSAPAQGAPAPQTSAPVQGMPPQGAPVPQQPAPPQGAMVANPVPTIDAASVPPVRGAVPPPAGGAAPTKRRW